MEEDFSEEGADEGLDADDVGDTGMESHIYFPTERRFVLPQGTCALQVLNFNIDPSMSSPDWDAIGRLFTGMNIELSVIETDPDCLNIVCKPGRPVNLALVGDALARLAVEHPRMIVMRVS